MKRRIEQVIAVVLAAILVGLAVHTPATIWVGTLLPDGIDTMLKAWKEVLLLAMIPLVQWLLLREENLRKRLLRDKVLWLTDGYILLHLIMLVVYWQGWWPSIAGLMIDLRFVLVFVVVYILLSAYPRARRWLLGAIVTGAVIIIGFATVQHVLPHDVLKHIGYGPDTVVPYLTVDRNYDYIRLSSTMRGPNPLGAYAVGVVLVAAALLIVRLCARRAQIGAGLLVVLSLVALWYSYSRSAKLALLAGLAVLVWVYRPWRYVSRRVLALAASGLIAVTMVAGALVWQSTWFSNVVLHTNPVDGSATQSNEEHWRSLVEGTQLMLAQPFGAGVGSTGSASLYGDNPLIIENQYLFIAHEVGWLGLVLFLMLFGLIMKRLYLRAADDPWAAGALATGVGMAVIGFVLPVWVDDVVSLVWWTLAAVVLAAPDLSAKQKTSQRSA